ncbi:MAG TPA: glycosyltransferase family 1 protein, partial [Thermoanaerobaculia bacterium]
PRKGIADLVDAWRTLPAPRPRLLLAGDRGWRTRIPDDAGIVVLGFVSRERLRDLYRGAIAFVYPSHFEGFGLPPLEAMACGAPVIATRTGAVPEFAGDAAVLVPPADRDALRRALNRVIGDAALRQELRERGPERASHYRWDASAKTMTALLAEAAR